MRSELFEETIKQHKDSLTDELVQLGKHRQAQLAEWDIEQNKTDYEFYFDSAWNHQQSKVDELQVKLNSAEERALICLEYKDEHRAEINDLQKRVDAAFRVLSQLNALDDKAHKRWKREACMFSQGESNAYEHAVRLLEQALKGGGE